MSNKNSTYNYEKYRSYYREKIPCSFCDNPYTRTYMHIHKDYCDKNPKATRTKDGNKNERSKKYYQLHREEILEKNKEKRRLNGPTRTDKLECVCGCWVTKYYIDKHRQTPKHHYYLSLK